MIPSNVVYLGVLGPQVRSHVRHSRAMILGQVETPKGGGLRVGVSDGWSKRIVGAWPDLSPGGARLCGVAVLPTTRYNTDNPPAFPASDLLVEVKQEGAQVCATTSINWPSFEKTETNRIGHGYRREKD